MNIPENELTFSEFVECCLRAGYYRYNGEPIPSNHPRRDLLTNSGSQGTYTPRDAMLQGIKDIAECLRNPKPKRPPSPRQGRDRGDRGDRDRDRDRDREGRK